MTIMEFLSRLMIAIPDWFYLTVSSLSFCALLFIMGYTIYNEYQVKKKTELLEKRVEEERLRKQREEDDLRESRMRDHFQRRFFNDRRMSYMS